MIACLLNQIETVRLSLQLLLDFSGICVAKACAKYTNLSSATISGYFLL